MSFVSLLGAFEQAAATHDFPGFAALFTPEGRYHDGFFGTHQGREAIAAMLERFHVGGERFAWQFFEPVANEAANEVAGEEGNRSLGYARYCFSYVSKEPESAGQLVVFEGMARFRLDGGLIADYDEVFDRGMAFVQLGYAGERVARLLKRYAQAWRESPRAREHVAWRERLPAADPSAPAQP